MGEEEDLIASMHDPSDFMLLSNASGLTDDGNDYVHQESEDYNPLGVVGDQPDYAVMSFRNAMAFWLAHASGQPFHKFEITRTAESVPSELSWSYRMQDRWLVDLDGVGHTNSMSPGDLIADARIQFQWVRTEYVGENANRESPIFEATPIAATEFIRWDASADEIRYQLERMMTTGGNPVFFGEGNVTVEGSLCNSWKADPYINYGNIDPETGVADDDKHDILKVTVGGKWANIPFNRYEFALRCLLYTGRYENQASVTDIEQPGVDMEMPTAPRDNDTFYSYNVWWEEYSVPLPPLRSQRNRITVESLDPETTSVSIDLGDAIVPINVSDDAATVETKLNAALGSVNADPKGVTVNVYEWDDEVYDFVPEAEELVTRWIPEVHAKSVTVTGTSLAIDGRLEVEWSGYGRQFSEQPGVFLITNPDDDPNVTVTETQAGLPNAQEIVDFSITGGTALGGDFDIELDAVEILNVAFDVTAASLQSQLEGHSSVGVGNVVVTGTTLDDGTLRATFAQSLNNVNVITTNDSSLYGAAPITVSTNQTGGIDGQLTKMTRTRGAGPSFWNVDANWDTGSVPTSGDTVTIDDAAAPLLYGLDQGTTFLVAGTDGKFLLTAREMLFIEGQKVNIRAGTGGTLPTGLTAGFYYVRNIGYDGSFYLSSTPNGALIVPTGTGAGDLHIEVIDISLTVYARYAGAQIGLPNYDGEDLEHLPTYLSLGVSSLSLGIDEGDGCNLFRLDSLTANLQATVTLTGSSLTDGIPPALFIVNHASAAITVSPAGEVGLSVYSGESSELDSLVIQAGGSAMIRNATIHTTMDAGTGSDVTVADSNLPSNASFGV